MTLIIRWSASNVVITIDWDLHCSSPAQLAREMLTPKEAAKLLLHRYSPPGVVINARNEVVHCTTRNNRWLELPVGEPTRDLLKLVREELRSELRTAIVSKVYVETSDQEILWNGRLAIGNQLVQKMSTTINDFSNFFRPNKESLPFSARKQIVEAIALVESSFHNSNISEKTNSINKRKNAWQWMSNNGGRKSAMPIDLQFF